MAQKSRPELIKRKSYHFYVNTCGFKIVSFYNAHHPDPHGPGGSDLPGGDESFGFEKVMGIRRD